MDYKLSWRASEQRFRKMYRGRVLNYSAPEGKVAGYRRCYEQFLQDRAKIDAELSQAAPEAVAAWQQFNARVEQVQSKLLETYPDSHETRLIWSELERQKVVPSQPPTEIEPDDMPAPEEVAAKLDSALPQLPATTMEAFGIPHAPPSTIPPWEMPAAKPLRIENLGQLVQAFMRAMKARCDREEISLARYDSLRSRLEKFQDAAGKQLPLSALDEGVLAAYADTIKDQVHAKKMAAITGRDCVAVAKQFLQWSFSNGHIDRLPRNLSALKIAVAAKKIETVDASTIKQLFMKAPQRTRLYILLAANCGFTQQDISDLRRDEIDLKAGTITRKRSKTKHAETVPTVCYKLWRSTLKALKAELSSDGELALLNDEGKQLVRDSLREDGKRIKADCIHSAWCRLLKAAGADCKFKQLRSSAASTLELHAEHARYAQQFLGHAPSSVADRHYVAPSQERFDSAIKWLGNKLGIDKAA